MANPSRSRLLIIDSGLILPAIEHWCEFDQSGISDGATVMSAGAIRPWMQATAGRRPTMTASAIDDRPAAVFDGDDWMSIGEGRIGGTGLFSGPNERFTVGWVGRVATHTGEHTTMLGRCEDSADGKRTFQLWSSNNIWQLTLRGVNNGLTAVGTAPHVHLITWDGLSARYYLDSAKPVALTVGTQAEAPTNTPIRLGIRDVFGSFLKTGSAVGSTLILSEALEGQWADSRKQLIDIWRRKWAI